jgi:UDP-2,3-diacylglucosamine hydrolase
MTAHTLFISDLHLDEARPEATRLLAQFLAGPALAAEAVYVLGDLFEYWLGDDVHTPLSGQVAEGFSALGKADVPCFFVHGNRDFLLGAPYAALAGLQLLAEETVVDLYGTPTLLMHGDQLCTDDVTYQRVRQQVRDPAWQAEFMKKTPAQRIVFAREARQQSEQHKQGVSEEIMDVNAAAVAAAFDRHGVKTMIHGHTHRPAIHEQDHHDGVRQRIVLGDWYTQGSVLRVSAGERELLQLPFARIQPVR